MRPFLSPYLNYLLVCLLFVFTPLLVIAQGENNNWTFGYQNGLNFTSGNPVPFTTAAQTAEGCAAVSNAAGQLLFYSNGNKVYTANHTVMPNGNGMLGNFTFNGNYGSAVQGVLIMPAIGSTTRYYLFTLDPLENFQPPVSLNYLRYSIIDMSLNGGLGDVVAGQKNIIIDSAQGEKMTAIRGDGCYNWLVTHELHTNKFHSFKVSAAGVAAIPVISTSGAAIVGPPSNTAHGYFQLVRSPNDSMIVCLGGGGAELHDFNRTTGVLSNYRALAGDVGEANYSCAFSANGKRLYIGRSGVFKGLAQFDFSLLPNMTAVNNSRLMLDTTYMMMDLRRAPNGKIYITTSNTGGIISVINNPDMPGTAANLVLNGAVVLPGGSGLTWGTEVVVAPPDSLIRVLHDTAICFGPPLTVNAPPGYTNYTWSDGSTALTNTFTTSGIKWVSGVTGCIKRIDSFRVASLSDTTFFSKDTTVCLLSGPVALTAPSGYASRIWNDGTTQMTVNAATVGTRWVISRNTCHYRIDTFRVIARPFDTTFRRRDTSVCFPAAFKVTGPAGYNSYRWSNGTTQQDASFSAPGLVWVVAQNACSLRLDTILVRQGRIDTLSVSFDTTLCFNPGITVNAKSGYQNYSWSDGGTGRSHSFNAPATVSVYMQDGCQARLETYRVSLIDFTIPLTGDTSLCKGDSILLDASVTGGQYTWLDNSHNPVFHASRPGSYQVTVSVGNCSKSAAMKISEKILSLDLGGNQKLCDGEEITLDAATPGVQYKWQDNSSGATLQVSAAGKNWVALSLASCQASDTVMVEYHNCNCMVTMPTAFTPNNDGHNDTYRPVIYGEPEVYELKIYNRWGQCVFTSFYPANGWDGTFNGRACDLGTYFYQLKVRCFRGLEEKRVGDVTLIR